MGASPRALCLAWRHCSRAYFAVIVGLTNCDSEVEAIKFPRFLVQDIVTAVLSLLVLDCYIYVEVFDDFDKDDESG